MIIFESIRGECKTILTKKGKGLPMDQITPLSIYCVIHCKK